MIRDAIISKDGKYRHQLYRRWSAGDICTFIMLNPSTADAHEDDPTVRRCIGFAQREECGALIVVNMFDYRATDPRELLSADRPMSRSNEEHIRNAVRKSYMVIAGWGNHSMVGRRQVMQVGMPNLDNLLCLGLNKNGSPKHPLYLSSDARLIRWRYQ